MKFVVSYETGIIFSGTLNSTFFGLNDSVEVDTHFFRFRAYDDEGNRGDWSNELSVSFVNPEDYQDELVGLVSYKFCLHVLNGFGGT